MPTSPQYLSTSQAAEHLGLSREHVRRLIQRGELHAEETVNGFMLYADKVEQYAIQRRVVQDQRQFRAAVDDLASQARRVDKATGIQSAVAQVRDQMKRHPAFEVPAVVAPQLRWIEQEVAAQKALATLAGSAATVVEQWRRYERDVRRAAEIFSAVPPGNRANGIGTIDVFAEKISAAQGIYSANVVSAMDHAEEKTAASQGSYSAKTISAEERSEEPRRGAVGHQGVYGSQSGNRDVSDTGAAANTAMHKWREDHVAALARKDDPLATASLVVPYPPEMARGFVVAESREARLEEKVDELNRKVEQLTELVIHQRADTRTAMPTWQEWAGSDRPEDVLTKLDAIRAGVMGGKQAGENSTDVIREAREARGQDG